MAAFNPWAAAEAYVATMSPAAMQKAIAYTHEQHWLMLWGFLASAVVALIILKTGVLRGLRESLEKNGPRPVSASFLVTFVALLLSAVLSLPWDIYSGWYVEKHFAMTSQPLAGWLIEHAIGTGLYLIGATLFFAALYFFMRRARRLWPLWGGVLAGVFFAVFLILGPPFIEPLFNTYTPAPNGVMRDAVVALAKQTGVPSDKIYIYNGSKQSNRYTANVSGIFGSARVAMSDVMFKKGATVSEVRGVMGHEMGHYVRGHAYWLTAAFTGLAMVVFFLTALFFGLFANLMGRKGLKGISDPAAFPVLITAFSFAMLLATPLRSSITRVAEADADRFSLEHAHDPDGLSAALIKTADYRAPQPSRLEEIVFYDHPSVFRRVYDAMIWKSKHVDLTAQTEAQDAALQKAYDAESAAGKSSPTPPVAPAPVTSK
jgi:STE24 endopeptidase